MSSSAKNILMFCSWFPNRVQPTNGNFAEKHIRLIAKQHQVTVFQVEYDPQLSFWQTEWVNSQQDDYHLLTIYFGAFGGKTGRFLKRLTLIWQAFIHLKKRNKHFNFLHIHVAMPGAIMGWLFHKIYRIPFILSCHSSGFLNIRSKPYSPLLKRILTTCANASKMVLPVSTALETALKNNELKTATTVIPNVVDNTIFRPVQHSIPTQPLRLLHISNFHPAAKNVEGILNVVKRLDQINFPFQITIAGDGDLDRIKNHAQKLNISSNKIAFRGKISEEEVAKLMQTHHLFILFSRYETQGVTLLEAQCSGMGIIATNVGGIPEIMSEEWMGSMVDNGDEDALLSAIKNIDTASLAINQTKIMEAAIGLYSESQVAKKFDEIYEKIKLET